MGKRWSGLVGALLASGALVAAAQADTRVPDLNVRQSCREAQAVSADGEPRTAGGSGQLDTYKACMQDEQQAKDQLSHRWSSFKPINRQNCVAQANPSPSYVEILTCLEMNDEAGIPFKADSSGLAAPTTPDSAVGSPPARPTTGLPAPSTGGRI